MALYAAQMYGDAYAHMRCHPMQHASRCLNSYSSLKQSIKVLKSCMDI